MLTVSRTGNIGKYRELTYETKFRSGNLVENGNNIVFFTFASLYNIMNIEDSLSRN